MKGLCVYNSGDVHDTDQSFELFILFMIIYEDDNSSYIMEGKEKNITAALKKISTNIETGRKNIEADSNLVENLNMVRGSFGEIESVIKGQVPALDTMKKFTK